MIEKFAGFLPHNGRNIPLPAAFFADLLPLIDDLAELKVTLFCFWALYQREGDVRYLRRRDFAGDDALMRGLANSGQNAAPEAALDAALERACCRATLLPVEIELDGGREPVYFLNTERGRTAVAQIAAGHWRLTGGEVEILPERPNIYRLYEENIGALTPLIVDALKDAERDYPAHWLEEAVRAAVENNARSWRYIQKVLARWQQEGKPREITERLASEDPRKKYLSDEYADFLNH